MIFKIKSPKGSKIKLRIKAAKVTELKVEIDSNKDYRKFNLTLSVNLKELSEIVVIFLIHLPLFY